MKVILLDKIIRLGDIGDVVNVKSGFARNFLIPQKKAMFANDENIKIVEAKKAELAAESEDLKVKAQAAADSVSGKEIVIKVSVSEEGTMYGSIGTREIEEACQQADIQIDKSQIQLPEGPIKEIGEHSVSISFHQEVSTEIIVKVESE
jgi:large subunit ribosomal protein L9|tara:strand:- start:900 stop:1346 length:447 start_codon:yes stop_codon:yes gene_type:complete